MCVYINIQYLFYIFGCGYSSMPAFRERKVKKYRVKDVSLFYSHMSYQHCCWGVYRAYFCTFVYQRQKRQSDIKANFRYNQSTNGIFHIAPKGN